jgi:hypothetical protein
MGEAAMALTLLPEVSCLLDSESGSKIEPIFRLAELLWIS